LTPSPTLQPASTSTSVIEPTWTSSPTISPPTQTPTLAPTQPDQEARNGPLIQAQFLTVKPLIDGKLEDWNLPSYSVNFVVYGANQWTGSADLSASVMLGWDEQNFFIAATVKDDSYVQTASGQNIFKGDSLEILMDTNLEADLLVARLSPDDFQLGFTPGAPQPGQSAEAYLWYPTSIKGGRSQARIGSTKTAEGYQVEAALPWSIFEVVPQAGMQLGFAFSVSDNDLAGQAVQQSMVSTVPDRHLTDPTTWGDMVLLK
jgi:hypothetical protein